MQPDIDNPYATAGLLRAILPIRRVRCCICVVVLTIISSLTTIPARAGACIDGNSKSDPLVVVTIKPIHSLVSALLEGAASPHLLVRGAASPHGFTLKPSDRGALGRARLLIQVSPDLEVFLEPVRRAAPHTLKILSLIKIPGLTLYNVRDPDHFGVLADMSDNDQKTGQGAGRKAGGNARHHHSGIDAHIWLDPENARRIASHLGVRLAEMFPDCKMRILANAEMVSARLKALDAELAAKLKPLAGKPYGIFHDAYQYLERRFGLMPVAAMSLSPDQHPGARRISALRQKLKTSGARCLFTEPQFQPRLINTIIEGTTIRLAVLDPLGASIPPGSEMYFTLLRNLATDLTKCLAPH